MTYDSAQSDRFLHENSMDSMADATKHDSMQQTELVLDPEMQINWLKVVWLYICVQAFVGIIAFEYAWAKTRRFREQDVYQDAKWDAFLRKDVKKWSRWKLYPGAIFLMPTRLLLLVLNGMLLMSVLSILTLGHDFKKGPMKNGCRKWCIMFFFRLCCSFFLFIAGMRTSLVYKDVDYEYYLGPDYRKHSVLSRRTSTIICNHVSWLDTIIILRNIRCAFGASIEFRDAPMLSTFINVLDGIYIPRGGSRENKDGALRVISDRQQLIERTGQFAPLLIFPEGTTANGEYLMPFKKGAFVAEKTIRPVFLKYANGTVDTAWDTIDALPILIFSLTWGCYHCQVNVLPDFRPTDYLFERHADKAKERWQIYAWALRSVLCEQGRFRKSSLSGKAKKLYTAYINMYPGATHKDEIDLDDPGVLSGNPEAD